MSEGNPGQRVIRTDDAPAAIGPYSQAIAVNGFVYTAGQIPLDPVSMEVVGDKIATQTEQVMKNLGAVLAAAESSLDRVVKTTCSTVQVAKLPMGVLVEVECVALAR